MEHVAVGTGSSLILNQSSWRQLLVCHLGRGVMGGEGFVGGDNGTVITAPRVRSLSASPSPPGPLALQRLSCSALILGACGMALPGPQLPGLTKYPPSVLEGGTWEFGLLPPPSLVWGRRLREPVGRKT